MKKKLLFPSAIFRVGIAHAQVPCPALNGPGDGDINAPTDATSIWNDITVLGHRIGIGTTLGVTKILKEGNLGNATTILKSTFEIRKNSPNRIRIRYFFFNFPHSNISGDVGLFSMTRITTQKKMKRHFFINTLEKIDVA